MSRERVLETEHGYTIEGAYEIKITDPPSIYPRPGTRVCSRVGCKNKLSHYNPSNICNACKEKLRELLSTK